MIDDSNISSSRDLDPRNGKLGHSVVSKGRSGERSAESSGSESTCSPDDASFSLDDDDDDEEGEVCSEDKKKIEPIVPIEAVVEDAGITAPKEDGKFMNRLHFPRKELPEREEIESRDGEMGQTTGAKQQVHCSLAMASPRKHLDAEDTMTDCSSISSAEDTSRRPSTVEALPRRS